MKTKKKITAHQGDSPSRVRSQWQRERVAEHFPHPGRTQQHFKDECDVNLIMKRFTETGLVTHLAKGQGEFGFASALTFSDAMFIVSKAEQEFSALPSQVRAHFDNDPALFLDAAQDDTRRSEFVELGLLEPLPAEPAEASTEPLKEPQDNPGKVPNNPD